MQYDSSDEIDLMALLVTLWKGKWLILLSGFLVAGLAATLLIFVVQPIYKGSMEVRPIAPSDELAYSLLNRSGFVDVSRGSLLSSLMLELELRRSLLAAVKEVGILEKRAGESEQEFERRLLEFVYSDINIVPPSAPDDKKNKPYWTIEVETLAREKTRDAIALALKSSTEFVRTGIIDKLHSEMTLHQKKQEYELQDLAVSAQNASSAYDEKVRNRIEFLKEQESIARTIGVAKSTIEAQLLSSGSSFVANVMSDVPFYLRGYEAIAKERKLIESRTDKESFVPELLELSAKRREIESDKRLQRAEEALKASPLLSEDFKVAIYEVNAMDFKSTQKRLLIIIGSLFLGGFLGMMMVLLRAGYKSYEARSNSTAG